MSTHITMVAVWALARQKLAGSSNGVGSRTSSDRRHASSAARFATPFFASGALATASSAATVSGLTFKATSSPLSARTRSESDPEILQQRQHADNDHDDTDDLLGAALDRQHVDKIENENDHQESDQDADEDGHGRIPCRRLAKCATS